MKACPNCGAECADAAMFCTECGARLPEIDTGIPEPEAPVPETAEETAEPVAETSVNEEAPAEEEAPVFVAAPSDEEPVFEEPVYEEAPAAPVYTARPVYEERPVVRSYGLKAKLKKIASSKLALVVAICFTALLALSMLSSAVIPTLVQNGFKGGIDTLSEYSEEFEAELDEIIEEYADDEEVKNALSGIDISEIIDGMKDAAEEYGVGSVGNAVSNAITAVTSNMWKILIAVAMWIIYGSAKKKDNECCNAGGITILKVLSVIKLVLVSLVAAIFVIIIIALLISTSGDGSTGSAAVYIIAGLFLLNVGLTIWFHAGKVSTLSRLKGIVNDLPEEGKISGFTGLVLRVGGIWKAIKAVAILVLVAVLGSEFLSAAVVIPVAAIIFVLKIADSIVTFGEGKFIKNCRKELAA